MSEENSPDVALMAFGGCGKNVSQYLQSRDSGGFLLVQVDDDADSLKSSGATIKLSYADCEDAEKMKSLFKGIRLFFMLGGLGGSACGHMPAMARSLAENGALGIALLTTPFKFENRQEKAGRDLKAISGEAGKVCVFSNSMKEGEGMDPQSIARRMRGQAEAMWLCVDAMTHKRSDPEKYDLEDLNRLVAGGVR